MFDEVRRVTGQSRVVVKIHQYSDLPLVNRAILTNLLTGVQHPFHKVIRPTIQSDIQFAVRVWSAAGLPHISLVAAASNMQAAWNMRAPGRLAAPSCTSSSMPLHPDSWH